MQVNDRFYFTGETVKQIISSMDKHEKITKISLDLNLNKISLAIHNQRLVLPAVREIRRSDLEPIVKTEKIYLYHQGTLSPIEVTNGNYYKLAPTADGAPTLQISGIQMHRTKNCDPFLDARQKVSEVVLKGDWVLDTCGGLGYTAIWSKRLGAGKVISVETDNNVSNIRRNNPWSEKLFNDPAIELVEDDIFEYIQSVPDEYFNSIVHDPPRFSLAGELYGREFYTQLYRVMKPGNRMFHYTGNPYAKGGKRDFIKGVKERLQEVGFSVLPKPDKLGILAVKK